MIALLTCCCQNEGGKGVGFTPATLKTEPVCDMTRSEYGIKKIAWTDPRCILSGSGNPYKYTTESRPR